MANVLLRLSLLLIAGISAFGLSSCGGGRDTRNKMIVSVRDQRMLLARDGKPVKVYPVSTSKYGLGDGPGTNRTPLGRMEVAKKIGRNVRKGTVFKHRQPTGEVIKPNSPGRDPIVTRILWLKGREYHNRNAFRRYIYIHGTPEEWRLGQPASYGCIRMASRDVVDLYRRIGLGAEVKVIRGSLMTTPEGIEYVKSNPRRSRSGA